MTKLTKCDNCSNDFSELFVARVHVDKIGKNDVVLRVFGKGDKEIRVATLHEDQELIITCPVTIGLA